MRHRPKFWEDRVVLLHIFPYFSGIDIYISKYSLTSGVRQTVIDNLDSADTDGIFINGFNIYGGKRKGWGILFFIFGTREAEQNEQYNRKVFHV